ncbi:MAG TPA: ATP-binding cassette domain-containing protein [Steroidobacteraceae bacterium]|nr:ATP-binding cassette domain-containing protein [Steroidobacteraceae bacterium]
MHRAAHPVSLLEARALAHSYPGGVRALDGLDLRIERGRRLAILGPNGSGKTTALLHLNGILKPHAGTVLLDGEPAAYDTHSLTGWRRRVGLVLQNADDQLFAATVAEDVSFGPLNLGLDAAQVRSRVQYALAALHVTALAERATHMLSFGQKKRVAIAGLVAMQPEVLLLDEPTAGLDRQGTEDLLAVLAELERSSGATLVLSTHDVDLAWRFADDVALFDSGRTISQGPVTETLMAPDLLRQAGLAMPFLLRFGLRAREVGMLGDNEPLPRTPEAALELLSLARSVPSALD